MATNKKITQLDELTPATWADDDVIAIVDISAQETKKIQLSTFRGAVTGVSSLNASTPLTVDSATGDVTIGVAINGGGTINAVFDEDDMTSNSPTALATQQSIKAYVDSQVGTVDTLAEILSNGNTSGGTNIVVSSGDVITTNTVNETTAASGVTIDGVLLKDGEVDGRDVSVDGTKLDTVETNADVTDTANVTAAGALMDSELTNITAVKALDQGVATTDTPTFAGLITAGNVDGRDVSVDGAKLDGIEAGADVTDTANVTAAGALMDSELTNIAAVKALDQGVATTDSPSFAGLTATTADINGGTIDGAVIGGASAAAGTFTTLTASGSLAAQNAVNRFGPSSGDADIRVLAGNAATSRIYFGDSDSETVGAVAYYHSANVFEYNQTLQMANAAGPSLLQEAATSTNPTIIPNKSDPDTGIGWVSADIGSLVAGGVNVLNWNSSGNVGIGTSSPSNVMTVSSATQYKGFTLRNGTNNVAELLGFAAGNDSGGLKLYTAGVAKAQVIAAGSSFFNGGNVGIGTSAPALNLHVHSSADTALLLTNTTSGSDADSGLEIKVLNSGAHAYINQQENAELRFRTNDTDRMAITSGGNLEMNNAAGPALMNEASSNTNPTVIHNRGDLTTGWGGASGIMDAVVGGVRVGSFDGGGYVTRQQGSAAAPSIQLNEDSTGLFTLGAGAGVGISLAGTEGVRAQAEGVSVIDGVTAPSTVTGRAIIYVDSADGDLKVKFADGHVAVIATDS